MKPNFGKKIRAKRESGLTAVWLKQDPPVYVLKKKWNNRIKC